MKLRLIYGILITALLAAGAAFPQQDAYIEVGNIGPGEVHYQGFTLDKDAEVHLKGETATFRDKHGSWFLDSDNSGWTNNLMFYCWILDSNTRHVVWHSLEKYPDIRTSRNTEFIPISTSLDLPAGDYEVYYASAKMNYNFGENSDGDFVSWIRNFFGFDGSEFRNKYRDKLSISVSGPSGVFHAAEIDGLWKKFRQRSIVSFDEVRNSRSLSKGFSLKGDTKLKLYAIGEGREKSIFDYAWIYDEGRNKIAWRMNWDNTGYAGGARKNIIFDNYIYLPEGTYTLHYVTDDSHSYQRWNSFPPNDPHFWGVSLFPATAADRANVIPFREQDINKPLVDLTKMRDNRFVSQGLKIKKPMEIRILCLGESTGGNEYSDFGWIINADTRQTVWTMDGRNADNAGGAEKNKMIDEKIKLQPGNYVVYYKTDDSHAYGDWNASAPFAPERWGISVWAEDRGEESETSLFTADNYRRKNILAEITHVGDSEHLRKTFDLDKATKIRVYAIGEGSDNSMFDYGWIEDRNSGRVVWDMSYRRTENAGGARKNRQINEVITLPAGKYTLYYQTDGSHSYMDWNADPPTDQDAYGITLSYVK